MRTSFVFLAGYLLLLNFHSLIYPTKINAAETKSVNFCSAATLEEMENESSVNDMSVFRASGTMMPQRKIAGNVYSQEPEIIYAAYRADYFGIRMFPGWFKSNCDGKDYNGSSLLLVKLTSDGAAILNPKDEDGRSTNAVDLKGLSFENAERLWGEPRGTTFDLIADSRAAMDIYHVDMKFKAGVLISYRVRGIGIPKPEWKKIE